jgi:hypothetical protein
MKVETHQTPALKVISDYGGERANLPVPKNTQVRQVSQWMIDHIHDVVINMSHPTVDISKRDDVGLKDALMSQVRSAEYLLNILRRYSSPPSPCKDAPDAPSQSESIIAINEWILSENSKDRSPKG